jgi:hypothetical protein
MNRSRKGILKIRKRKGEGRDREGIRGEKDT